MKTQKQRTDARNPKDADLRPVKRLFGPVYLVNSNLTASPTSGDARSPVPWNWKGCWSRTTTRRSCTERTKPAAEERRGAPRWRTRRKGSLQVFCVVVSLAEAEILRRWAQHWTADMTGADASLCSNAGLWRRQADIRGGPSASERPMTARARKSRRRISAYADRWRRRSCGQGQGAGCG